MTKALSKNLVNRRGSDRRPYVVPAKLQQELSICHAHPEKVLFLDIETTGLSHFYDEITIVGWSFDGKAQTLIKGDNPDALLSAASNAEAMITFNGIRFDNKFLKKEFEEIELPPVHIDLMYLCRRAGLKGGQKSIERQLGISFREEIESVDGAAAVLLWHRFLRGDKEALNELIFYNRVDIAAMGAIFDKTIKRLGFQSDLFSKTIQFEEWSAPKYWKELPTFRKRRRLNGRKAATYASVFGNSPATQSRIVGIDLTGSEKRPTGWCVLDGTVAATRLLSTDDDLITATVDAEPTLVSIDSPLCLPYGRLSVFDDDPSREKYGIMRECERELKRRGVNVYPSLIPSMQKLTARGISLAEKFRKLGIPVIESYPGAAQDIMRIPRKGRGVEWLRIGLQDFGISGTFDDDKVTHDELDAITSALVGVFHLAGRSEALGTEHEAPLIIPEMTATDRPVVIGISGPIAAGKTTASRFLEQKGFAYTRFSLVIDEILEERGQEVNRSNRQQLGGEINKSGRQRELAERTIRRVEGRDRIVVDGLRFPEDHAFLVEKFGSNFTHLFIEAGVELRKARFSNRLGKDSSINDRDFESASESEVERKVINLKSLAKATLKNEGSLADLEKNLTTLL